MSEFDRHPSSRQVSRLNVSPLSVDMTDTQDVGRTFFATVYRMLRIGALREPDHDLAREAIEQFSELFESIVRETSVSKISLEIDGEFAVVNGTTLALKPAEQRRLDELRAVYEEAGIRKVSFDRPLETSHLERFLRALHGDLNSEFATDLDELELEHVRFERGSTQRPIDGALREVALPTYAGHLFARLLIKTRSLHRRLQREPRSGYDILEFRQMCGAVARLLAADCYPILGLPPQQLLSSSRATHSVHSAIYAIFTALRAGTPIPRAAELGTALLLEDLAALRGYERIPPTDLDADGLDDERIDSNIAAVRDAILSSNGSPAAALADILLFERGASDSGKLGPPLYTNERRRHAAARLVEVVRTYDAELQGRRESPPSRPPQAIESVSAAAGTQLDSTLATFFVDSMGRYPVGTCVRLSTGHTGLVIAPPRPDAPSDRPTVRPFDYLDRRVDLASDDRKSISIEGIAEPPDDESLDSLASVVIRPRPK